MLPKSFGDGSLVKAQVTPHGIKNLLPTTGTAIRGVTSGKVTIPKVLHHHKLPDQQRVKDIYEKVHAREDRIELNLYIVGEDADELEEAGVSEVTPVASMAPAGEEGES